MTLRTILSLKIKKTWMTVTFNRCNMRHPAREDRESLKSSFRILITIVMLSTWMMKMRMVSMMMFSRV